MDLALLGQPAGAMLQAQRGVQHFPESGKRIIARLKLAVLGVNLRSERVFQWAPRE